MLKILDVESHLAKDNMKIDSLLLNNLKPNDMPILRLYEWKERALSYGYFIKCEKFINVSLAKKRNIAFTQRPTGGGIVFHISDLTFSFFMPKNNKFFFEDGLKNYQFINTHVLATIKEVFGLKEEVHLKCDMTAQKAEISNFCMAKPTKYDVLFNGKKIAGAAQRNTKNGYLHQASIFLAPIEEEVLEIALFPTNDLRSNSYFLLNNEKQLPNMRKMVFQTLRQHFSKTFL